MHKPLFLALIIISALCNAHICLEPVPLENNDPCREKINFNPVSTDWFPGFIIFFKTENAKRCKKMAA